MTRQLRRRDRVGDTTSFPCRTVTGMALCVAIVFVWLAPILAQTPQQHEQHHPAKPPASQPPGQPAPPSPTNPASPDASPQPTEPSPQTANTMGAMGQGASQTTAPGQLCCGGAPPPAPLYPALMAMPELTPERRQELERQATERMAGGTAMMADAFARLTAATQAGDAAAMQQANVVAREGLAQFESGLALRRALDEGRAPRDVAIEWFRREMNLVPLTNSPPPHGLFGLSWFHYIVMVTLAAFAVAMIGMYFSKMRRAQALVARLAGVAPGAAATLPLPSPVATSAARTSTVPSLEVSTPPPEAAPPVAAPSRPNSWTGLLRVARIFQETPTVKSFRLTDPAGGPLPFAYLPGQFLTVTVAPDGEPIKRSYTIASSPAQRAYAEITVKREEHGVVSQFLHDRLREGDTLQVTAPSGKFTFTGEDASSVVLIAGGVGVTPMMSVTRYLTERAWSGEIHFLYAARSDAEVIFREELEYLRGRYPNLHLMLVVEEVESSEWPYAKGRITRELLESTVPQLTARRVHLCGPLPMMNAVKAILTEMSVPADHIRTEIFQGTEPPRPKLATLAATQAKVGVVTFAKSRRTAMLPPTKTVLEASEDVGVNIDYSCRVGTCGVCRTKLLSGTVTMDVEDGLEPGDKDKNIILACQAKSTADITVDA